MWTRGVTDGTEKVAVGLGDALLNMVLAEESNGPSASFRVLFSLEFWLESRWLPFHHFNPLTLLLRFASVSLQFGGLIRNQIRYEAKDKVESKTGRIRPLDGNLLQQQRKGIYQKIQPSREACSKTGL
jgi:hypothetical protein